MKIDRIYIAGYRLDVRLTQCCVASIRRWYPDVPISLVKDESHGDYDTSDLERAWGVTVFDTPRRRFGLGFGKLEPLLRPGGGRCLVLDSDTVFLGRVLDRLERFDEDFVVDAHACPDHAVDVAYFDRAALAAADPDFAYPGYTFNTGQLVGTAGVLRREDFEPWVELGEPPRVRDPELFKAGEQGVVNYVLMKRHAAGELTLRREPFMRWSEMLEPDEARVELLTADSPYDFLVHWAGNKFYVPGLARNAHLLEFFDGLYHTRVAASRDELVRRRMTRLLRDSGRAAPAPPREAAE